MDEIFMAEIENDRYELDSEGPEKRARKVMSPEDWLLWYRHKQLERRREIKRLINQKLDEYFAEEDLRV